MGVLQQIEWYNVGQALRCRVVGAPQDAACAGSGESYRTTSRLSPVGKCWAREVARRSLDNHDDSDVIIGRDRLIDSAPLGSTQRRFSLLPSVHGAPPSQQPARLLHQRRVEKFRIPGHTRACQKRATDPANAERSIAAPKAWRRREKLTVSSVKFVERPSKPGTPHGFRPIG